MKKAIGSVLVFMLSTMIILSGCTKYSEDKVYSEKDTNTYSAKKEVNKVGYITRNEAVKIGKDLLKKAGNIDVDNMNLKEEVILNKDEKENKFEWDIKWGMKDDINSQMITIDANTGEIKVFGVYLEGKIDTKEIFKLSKEEIDKILGDVLKVINKDINNYKIKYDHDNEIIYFKYTGAKQKREDMFRNKGSLKDGYVKFAIFEGESESERIFAIIDSKEKKLISFYIEPRDDIEDNKAKGVSVLMDTETGEIKDMKKMV